MAAEPSHPNQPHPAPVESNPDLLANGTARAKEAAAAQGLAPDQLETVAVEAESGPVSMPKTGEPLLVAEYTTDEALLQDYAELLSGQRQRTFAFAMCVVDFVLATMIIVTWPQLWVVALVLAVLGAYMVFWRRRASQNTAKRLLKGLDSAELHRVVSVYGDRVVLTKANGVSHEYARTDLSDLKHNETVAVLVFGNLGVTVPRSALSDADWNKLLAWGANRDGNGRAYAEQQEKTREEQAARDLEADETPTQSH